MMYSGMGSKTQARFNYLQVDFHTVRKRVWKDTTIQTGQHASETASVHSPVSKKKKTSSQRAEIDLI